MNPSPTILSLTSLLVGPRRAAWFVSRRKRLSARFMVDLAEFDEHAGEVVLALG